MTRADLLITGVGGQGNILASDIVCEVALASGCDVKKTDTLGMAQRGGSVISHVRFGEHVFSPLIEEGQVDILLAFEKLEGVRWASFLKPGALAVVNNFEQHPSSVSLGLAHYPDDMEVNEILKQRTDRIFLVEGTQSATKLGNGRTLNIYMLGCLSTLLSFSVDVWKQVITAHLPVRLVELNILAFDTGREEINGVHVG